MLVVDSIRFQTQENELAITTHQESYLITPQPLSPPHGNQSLDDNLGKDRGDRTFWKLKFRIETTFEPGTAHTVNYLCFPHR